MQDNFKSSVISRLSKILASNILKCNKNYIFAYILDERNNGSIPYSQNHDKLIKFKRKKTLKSLISQDI